MIKLLVTFFVFSFPKNLGKRCYQSTSGTTNAPEIQICSVPVIHTNNTDQQNCIRLHVLQTVSIIKLSLSPFDDNCFIHEGGIKNLPYGHADAIEATDLESDPEWDETTQDEIQDLFGEE